MHFSLQILPLEVSVWQPRAKFDHIFGWKADDCAELVISFLS